MTDAPTPRPITGPAKVPSGLQGPKVNGRKAFLQMVDSKIAEESNIHKLAEQVQAEIDTDPGRFIREVIMPLTPNTFLEGGANDTAEDKARQIRDALAKMEASMGTIKAAVPAVADTAKEGA